MLSAKLEPFNPLYAFLYFRMGLKAWTNYASLIQQKQKECEEHGIPYESSESEESDSDFYSSDYSDSDSEWDVYEAGMEEIPEGDSDESDSDEEDGIRSRQPKRSINISARPSDTQQMININDENGINLPEPSNI